jgi:hypothetical protein
MTMTGCGSISILGSGNLITKEYHFEDFTSVEAQSGFSVEVIRSDNFSVEITTDDNIQEQIRVKQSGDTLTIGLKSIGGRISVTLEAKITMPELRGISLSGGSQADITGFNSRQDLSVELSGGSRLNGDITADDTDFDLSGGSRVELVGAADDLSVNSSGGSQLFLENFTVDDADINISGGGRATVNVNGSLDVNLSGGSRVLYTGEPTEIDSTLSGGSGVSSK